MDYTSLSAEDQEHILKTIGLPSLEELIDRILPERFQLDRALDLPEGISEQELLKEFKELAGANLPAGEGLCLMGGGVYDHYIPAAISHIMSRSEFYTAYTPYQAEVSQGTLQTIYEFQTMICNLMGMDTASASHYDGATALAEAVLIAVRKKKKKAVVIPAGLNPSYQEVLETYCRPVGIEIRTLGSDDGKIEIDEVVRLADGASAVVIQHPNFYGLLEPIREAAQAAHNAGALVISSTYPVSLALLEPPGEWGADIATAEGQPFGAPMSLGGPYVGLFAVKKPLIRMMPGRLVGRTNDVKGQDGYVLTLQTREQHIRREKATSNICTNQALVALGALVYLSLVGKKGLIRVAENSYRSTHYLAKKLVEIPDVNLHFEGDFFNEFVIDLPKPAVEIQEALASEGIFIGPPLGRWDKNLKNSLLVAVTEKPTRADLDGFVEVFRKVIL
ncbi:MAG: aminomethyl-transferring glycine dehydrogenase subunit GcvPA [Candidatus Hatepunaea meridiana]|nr:aminomethyl-transferring glycine dehydrogenase subunit GcvPA [Candidatus Hatepunaea meridiana]